MPAKGKGDKVHGNIEAVCNSTMRMLRRQSLHLSLETAPLIIWGLINSDKKLLLSSRPDKQSQCHKTLHLGDKV